MLWFLIPAAAIAAKVIYDAATEDDDNDDYVDDGEEERRRLQREAKQKRKEEERKQKKNAAEKEFGNMAKLRGLEMCSALPAHLIQVESRDNLEIKVDLNQSGSNKVITRYAFDVGGFGLDVANTSPSTFDGILDESEDRVPPLRLHTKRLREKNMNKIIEERDDLQQIHELIRFLSKLGGKNSNNAQTNSKKTESRDFYALLNNRKEFLSEIQNDDMKTIMKNLIRFSKIYDINYKIQGKFSDLKEMADVNTKDLKKVKKIQSYLKNKLAQY